MTTARALQEEATRLIAAIPRGSCVWVLDEHGKDYTSPALAQQLEAWRQNGRDLALIIGGADGLAPDIKQRATGVWSLSRLTLPHALVRVLVVEQLYRAWTLLMGHPYHRD